MSFHPTVQSLKYGVSPRPLVWPLWLIVITIITALIALGLYGPIEQWASYHEFADTASLWGIPNALNVLSNIPFPLVGVAGLLWLAKKQPSERSASEHHTSTNAWRLFACAITITGLGSSLYHWMPNNSTLIWDRLPIAWVCAALSCGLLSERVHPRWSHPICLAMAMFGASVSVAWWWWTLAPQGSLPGGDLRPYLVVQFLPMLLIPLLTWRPPRHASALSNSSAWAALALYAAAKLMEMGDHAVMETVHALGGHPFKHLLAAAAAAVLLKSVSQTRR